jgi:hypothetical protein
LGTDGVVKAKGPLIYTSKLSPVEKASVILNKTFEVAVKVMSLPVTPTPSFWQPAVAGEPDKPKQNPYQPAPIVMGVIGGSLAPEPLPLIVILPAEAERQVIRTAAAI